MTDDQLNLHQALAKLLGLGENETIVSARPIKYSVKIRYETEHQASETNRVVVIS